MVSDYILNSRMTIVGWISKANPNLMSLTNLVANFKSKIVKVNTSNIIVKAQFKEVKRLTVHKVSPRFFFGPNSRSNDMIISISSTNHRIVHQLISKLPSDAI